MTTAVTRGYVDGPHGQLHYRRAVAGTHAGHPLILFHQNPSSSFEYEPLIHAMARDREVIALDTPGYGMSDAPDAPLDMAGYAAGLVAALPALGIEAASGCDVYGFHTGALLAIEAALARPDLVRRVALTGLPMRTPAECAERLAAARSAPAIDEAGEVPFGNARRLWDYVVGARTPGVDLHRAAHNWIDKLRTLERTSWAYVGVWNYEFAARLPLVEQPVLLLQPHEEILDQSLAAVALFPDHRVVELPQWQRDVLDLPDAVAAMAEALRRFFDQPLFDQPLSRE